MLSINQNHHFSAFKYLLTIWSHGHLKLRVYNTSLGLKRAHVSHLLCQRAYSISWVVSFLSITYHYKIINTICKIKTIIESMQVVNQIRLWDTYKLYLPQLNASRSEMGRSNSLHLDPPCLHVLPTLHTNLYLFLCLLPLVFVGSGKSLDGIINS